MQKYYAAIDLHSNNGVLTVIDENDKVVRQRKLPNRLDGFVRELEPFREALQGVAVESTFNWYWLVDGLLANGYRAMLVNTAAIQQYEGLKHSDDQYDAWWLAHMMRLGILPTGHIHPRGERAVRDLMRKRLSLVQQRTANILSVQNLEQRNRGTKVSAKEVKKLTARRPPSAPSARRHAITGDAPVLVHLHDPEEPGPRRALPHGSRTMLQSSCIFTSGSAPCLTPPPPRPTMPPGEVTTHSARHHLRDSRHLRNRV